MTRTHYETLGIKPTSDAKEIRAAYRRLVLVHHPDRSKDPKSADLFIKITEAYEALSDPARRTAYDALLKRREERAKAAKPPAPAPTPPKPTQTVSTGMADTSRMVALFRQGRLSDAEAMALKLLEQNDRLAVAYAVLGDIAQQRGDVRRASKMYAYALQMDPRNDIYLRKNEELAQSGANLPDVRQTTDGGHIAATAVGFGLSAVACTYVVLSKEKPFLSQLAPISTWTVGLVVMLLLAGVAIGASLSVGRMLDRFQSATTTATGASSPIAALATVAAINFWAALALYALLGMSQNAFNVSTTRLMAAVVGVIFAFAAASGLSGHIAPTEVLLWGGNLTYLGAVCGWMATDSLRA